MERMDGGLLRGGEEKGTVPKIFCREKRRKLTIHPGRCLNRVRKKEHLKRKTRSQRREGRDDLLLGARLTPGRGGQEGSERILEIEGEAGPTRWGMFAYGKELEVRSRRTPVCEAKRGKVRVSESFLRSDH